jgi:uncharacterized protein
VLELARSVIFPGCPVAFPPVGELERLHPRVSLLAYRTDDGLDLVGAWARSTASGAPVVVYFHGNAESAAQNLDLASDLAGRGTGVFLAEYRGYGGMPGRPTEGGLYRDGVAAVRAVESSGIPTERLVLAGRSLGSGVAVELARRGFGRALVLISPYTSVVDLGRRLLGPLAPLVVADRFDSLAKLPGLKIPAVILHGTRDEVVPFAMGEALARAGPRARLVALRGRGHNDIPDLAAQVERALAMAA